MAVFYRALVGVFCILTALLGGATQANAQTLPQPPVISAIDQNNVNLATGLFAIPDINVGIGIDGSGLSRVASATAGADNYTGTLNITCHCPPNGMGSGGPSELWMQASYAGQSMQFHVGYTDTGPITGVHFQSGGDGTAKIDCSSYSPFNCLLTLRDGTTVSYTNIGAGSAMTAINRADGEVITFTYYTAIEGTAPNTYGVNKGIKSVSSSNGWMLKYERAANYALTQVTALNTSVDYCDPAASSCPGLSSGYPVVKKGVYADGETKIAKTASGSNPTEVIEIRLPSATVLKTPSGITKTFTIYTAADGADKVGKVKTVQVGGQTWNYAYTVGLYGAISTTITAPDLTTRTMAVNERALITSQTDELGRQTVYTYDGAGRLLRMIPHDATYSGSTLTGGYTDYHYDAQGNLDTTSVYPRNGGAPIVASATYPGSGCAGKACHSPLTTTDASGAVTTYTYDSVHGGVTSVIAPAAYPGASRLATFYGYALKTPQIRNASGVLVSGTPAYKLISKKTCAVQLATSISCDVPGDTLWTQTALSYDVDLGYSGSTRNLLPVKTVLTRGDTSATLTSESYYNKLGQIIYNYGPKASDDSSTDITPKETFSFFDDINRPIGAIGADPDGSSMDMKRPAKRSFYNVDGKISKQDDGFVPSSNYSGTTIAERWASAYSEWSSITNGVTVLERNTTEYSPISGLPIRTRHYAAVPVTGTTLENAVIERSYDSRFRVSCEAERLLAPADLAALTSSTPNACLKTAVPGPDGFDRITQYTYDPAGQRLTTKTSFDTPDIRTASSNQYSNGSQPAPDGSTISKGMLASITDAKGNKTAYSYDDFGRVKKIWYPNQTTAGAVSTTDVEETIYSAGRISTQRLRDYSTNGTSYVTFNYDSLGRVIGKSGAVVESFTYDVYNNVLTHNNQTTNGPEGKANYSYNALGSILSATYQLGTGASRNVSYTYNTYGQRTRLTWPDGYFVKYSYYAAGTPWLIQDNNSIDILREDHDQYGRQITKKLGSSSPYAVITSLGYDDASRLNAFNTNLSTSAASTGYDVNLGLTYTAANQIKTQTRSNIQYDFGISSSTASSTFNGLNQIATFTASGTTNFGHDGRGNLISDGAATYSYNPNNLMVSVVGTGGTTALSYDAENRLARIARTGNPAATFLYDRKDLIAEYDDSGVMTARYVHGFGSDEPIVSFNGSATGEINRNYLVSDPLGSIIAITNSTGDVGTMGTGVNAYDEYGLPRAGNLGRFQYTGQVFLPEIAMYYYKSRMYSPSLGRFLQPDPIGYGDGMNAYNYVHSDPVNGSDPDGLAEYGGNPGSDAVEVVVRGMLRPMQMFDASYQNQCSVAGTGCGGTMITQIPISAAEAQMAKDGDVNGFWAARAKDGDGIGELGDQFGNSKTKHPGVLYAKNILRFQLMKKYGLLLCGSSDCVVRHDPKLEAAMEKEYVQIRIDLMRAHVAATNADEDGVPHNLSPQQIAQYHWEVFAKHGLPSKTFGGTSLTGTSLDLLYARTWCASCDQ